MILKGCDNPEVVKNDLFKQEEDIRKVLVSLIILYGDEGLPLEYVNSEYEKTCGHSIPYKIFGCDTLYSFLHTLKEIYIVTDEHNKKVLFATSQKSEHIKELINNQKRLGKRKPLHPQGDFDGWQNKKRRIYHSDENYNREIPSQGNNKQQYRKYQNSNNRDKFYKNFDSKITKFEELQAMLPLFYNHQALGDAFFLDVADTKMGYYVSEEEPKTCGLCVDGQTISELTYKVKGAKYLAPRVVVMIGLQDLISRQSFSKIMSDLRELVSELKRHATRVTLITLVPTPKMSNAIKKRLEIYNQSILEYQYEAELFCNVIDMNTIFKREAATFRRDFDRFHKVIRKDTYQVFSDYGRKVFLNALKAGLRMQLESDSAEE